MSELPSLWGFFLRDTVTPVSSSAAEGAFSSFDVQMCPPTQRHRDTCFLQQILPPPCTSLMWESQHDGSDTRLGSSPAAASAALAWKSRRQEGARIILGVNSVWRKCGQGDPGRSKSWQSVCLSVCLCVTDPEETCGYQEGCSALPTVEICLQLCQVFIIGVVIANGCLSSGLLPLYMCIRVCM